MTVIVLAAGGGTRMKSKTMKVLHPIAGRSMIGHVLEAVAALEPRRVVAVVGSQREQVGPHIQQLLPQAVLAVQESQDGTGHAVRVAWEALDPADRTGTVEEARPSSMPFGPRGPSLLRTQVTGETDLLGVESRLDAGQDDVVDGPRVAECHDGGALLGEQRREEALVLVELVRRHRGLRRRRAALLLLQVEVTQPLFVLPVAIYVGHLLTSFRSRWLWLLSSREAFQARHVLADG